MSICLGDTELSTVALGDTELAGLYLGETEIWTPGGAGPIYKIAGYSSELPMIEGEGTAPIPSIGKNSSPFIAHRKYYSSADTGSDRNVRNATDEINGEHIEIQLYGGVYHDISSLSEWSAKIKVGGPYSWDTPNRGYDLINSFENYNMHIFYEDYWGEKIYIVPQDLVESPIVYSNPFGFELYGTDRLRMTTVPSGYSKIKEWLRNSTTDSHGSYISQGREFWLGIKDGYLYTYLEGHPICKQAYSKTIDKLNIGWLDTRSGNDYYSGFTILNFEIYDSFIFEIPADPE